MRILLAEDSALLREGLVALLERAGHQIVGAAATATELLSLGAADGGAEAADLVLTDVRMPPGMGDDGLRAALELRARRPGLPVVLLSQYAEQSCAERLLADGSAVGYLLKDRVAHVHDFLRALESVRAGGVVIDPEVISSLLHRRPDHLAGLTAREREVLALVAEGMTNQQVAQRLHLSQGAVVKHVSSAFDALGISERAGNHPVLAVLAYLRR